MCSEPATVITPLLIDSQPSTPEIISPERQPRTSVTTGRFFARQLHEDGIALRVAQQFTDHWYLFRLFFP